MRLSLSCKESARLVSEGLDRELSAAERSALRLHLAFCATCQRLNRQFEFLRRAAGAYPGRDDPDQDKK